MEFEYYHNNDGDPPTALTVFLRLQPQLFAKLVMSQIPHDGLYGTRIR